MNTSPSNIKKACLVFGALFVLSIPIVWISLFFTTYHGDLTRIGKWTEHDFSWQIPQPYIDSSLLQSSPIDQADVLVIGDSFSETLHWQSIFTKDQIKVTTIHWGQIDNICENFKDLLKQNGFKGKKIIIQSTERGFKNQLEKSSNCSHGNIFPKSLERSSKAQAPLLNPRLEFNINGQFTAGFKTILNSLAIRASDQYHFLYNYRSKSGHIYKIENGCAYFSNRLCEYGLFFHEDYKKPSIDANLVSKVRDINRRLSDYKVSWLVIPNKSSIYHRPVSSEFWEDLEQEKLGPNLYQLFQEQKILIKDLYAPNDSHLSTNGYLLIGTVIKKHIQ